MVALNAKISFLSSLITTQNGDREEFLNASATVKTLKGGSKCFILGTVL